MVKLRVRVAFGTGALLGLWHGRVEVAPTTGHFLTYHEGRCEANCKFCPQARDSTTDLRMLSRVVWPVYDFEEVIQKLSKSPKMFERFCIQSVNYPDLIEDLCILVEGIKRVSRAPVSISTHPLSEEEMLRLKSTGVQRVCIPLDACTPEIFSKIKEGYGWEEHLDAIEAAGRIFEGVTTHLIVGLGETEEEAVRTIQDLTDRGVTIGLFAFTPVRGTQLEKMTQPKLEVYRRVQLAHHLIQRKMGSYGGMGFVDGKLTDLGVGSETLDQVSESGWPHRTSGCPGCNRPFYNESPRGPIYNYPRKPTKREIEEMKSELGLET